jgi:UDP-glucose 4-epimerase
MANYLVTGVAGFIGSHVAERLIARGDSVRGVDSFTNYYSRSLKEANLSGLLESDRFVLDELDLSSCDLDSVLKDVDAVCHLAAQAGVRASWGRSFETYTDCNIIATQRLLEACKGRPLTRFVYASSSSVYGDTDDLPMRERGATCPVSPYGVTKLAGEHLAVLYHRNYRLPTVSLRFFTVYGPRQRPDMAFNKFISAALSDRPIEVFGDGGQTRDFTFIDDIVDGVVSALAQGSPGEVYNLGGGSRVSLNEAIDTLERVMGIRIERQHGDSQKGDVRDTLADGSKARSELGFAPSVGLEEGLAREFEWLRSLPGMGDK